MPQTPPTPDVRLHNRVVVVAAARSPMVGGNQVASLVRQLSLDQFENEGRRVRDYDTDQPYATSSDYQYLPLVRAVSEQPAGLMRALAPRRELASPGFVAPRPTRCRGEPGVRGVYFKRLPDADGVDGRLVFWRIFGRCAIRRPP